MLNLSRHDRVRYIFVHLVDLFPDITRVDLELFVMF